MPTIEQTTIAEANALRSRLKSFAYKVGELREAQKAYFKDKRPSDLSRALKLERELDAELLEFNREEHSAPEPQLAMDFDEI